MTRRTSVHLLVPLAWRVGAQHWPPFQARKGSSKHPDVKSVCFFLRGGGMGVVTDGKQRVTHRAQVAPPRGP